MKKISIRILAVILVLTLSVSLFALPSLAEESAEPTPVEPASTGDESAEPTPSYAGIQLRSLFGDANGDAVIDSKDLAALRKYFASFDYETMTSSAEAAPYADANGDGFIDSKDLAALRKYFASFDYETGTSSVVLGELAPIKVLFLGNSLTYYNDMPDTVEALGKAAGQNLAVSSVTKGSATVAQFADASTDIGAEAQALLANEYWDYVIIEPSRRITPKEDTIKTAEINASKFIQGLADDAGAELLLYSVWGNNDGQMKVYEMTGVSTSQTLYSLPITHQEHTAIMHDEVLDVAEALGGVRIVEAGYAFENMMAADPTVNLYYTDNRHPSEAGSYLVAAAFVGVLFGEPTAEIDCAGGLDADLAAALRAMADKTVFEGLVPDLTVPEEEDDKSFKLLVVGSDKMNNYAIGDGLGKLTAEYDDFAVKTTYVMDSSFTNTQLVSAETDLGLRSAIAAEKWDAIVLQLSRRNTISATDVAASEKAALAEIMPLLKAVTDNIYLFVLNSDKNPTIFKVDGTTVNYAKTSKTESCTAEEGTAYFDKLAADWAEEFGITPIYYGDAYLQIKTATGRKQTAEDLKYLQPCCLYTAMFGKTVAAGSALEKEFAASADVAAALRTLVPLAVPSYNPAPMTE